MDKTIVVMAAGLGSEAKSATDAAAFVGSEK